MDSAYCLMSDSAVESNPRSPPRKKRRIADFFSPTPTKTPTKTRTASSNASTTLTPTLKRVSFRKKRIVSNKQKKAKPSTPTSRYVPKEVKTAAIGSLCTIAAKVMSALFHLGKVKKEKINMDVKQLNEEELKGIENYTSGRQLRTKELHILKDLDSLILIAQTTEKAIPKELLITTEFVKQYALKHEDDCIQRSDDKKWRCTTCVLHFDEQIWQRLKGSGGYLATAGDNKYRATRTYAHLIGACHRELKAKGKGKAIAVPALFNSHRHSRELFLTKIVVTVYVVIKRQGASAHFLPMLRCVESMAAHYNSLPHDKYRPWQPTPDDAQYNNPTYFNYIRGLLANHVNNTQVTPKLKKCVAAHHILDGYDDKQERYNNVVSVSMPDTSVVTMSLGCVSVSLYGAKGGVEAIFKSWKLVNINTRKKRPNSLGYDGTLLNTGTEGGIGALYAIDCAANGFDWKPAAVVCSGHHGQNYQKVYYNTKPDVMKQWFVPVTEPLILQYLDTKSKVAQTAVFLCRSNYYDLFVCFTKKLGYNTNQFLSITSLKDIRMIDHLYTTLLQLKRMLCAVVLWCYHLIVDKECTVGLKNVAHSLIAMWANYKSHYLLHMTLDCAGIFNRIINLKSQLQKDEGWIGDWRGRPEQFKKAIRRLSHASGPYEQDAIDGFDAETKTLFGLPLLDAEGWTEGERERLKNAVVQRHIDCAKRLLVGEYTKHTHYVDPTIWHKQDIVPDPETDTNSFCESFGDDTIAWYQREHESDLNLGSMRFGFVEAKYWWLENYHSKNKECNFREFFKALMFAEKKDRRLSAALGDFVVLLHRINSKQHHAMEVENRNADIRVIHGLNRNFAEEGVNECLTVRSNGPSASTFDPRPVVNDVLAKGMRFQNPNLAVWKKQPYLTGLFHEANITKQGQRAKYRERKEQTIRVDKKLGTLNMVDVRDVTSKRMRRKAAKEAKKVKAKEAAQRNAAQATSNSNVAASSQVSKAVNKASSSKSKANAKSAKNKRKSSIVGIASNGSLAVSDASDSSSSSDDEPLIHKRKKKL